MKAFSRPSVSPLEAALIFGAVAVATILVALLISQRIEPAWVSGASLEDRPLSVAAPSGAAPRVLLAGTASGVQRSTDNGKSWEKPSVQGVPFFDFAFGGSSLFAASAGYVYFSDDQGGIWSRLRGLPPLEYRAVALSSSGPGTEFEGPLWAGAFRGGLPSPSLFSSEDPQRSWSPVDEGPGRSDITEIETIEDRVAVGTGSEGLFVGEPRASGYEWRRAEGIPHDASVTALAAPLMGKFTKAQRPAAQVVAGTDDGNLFVSGEGLRNWRRIASPVKGNAPIVSLLVIDSLGQEDVVAVLVGGRSGGVFLTSDSLLSENGSVKWKRLPLGAPEGDPPAPSAMTFDSKSNRLFVVGENLFKTGDKHVISTVLPRFSGSE